MHRLALLFPEHSKKPFVFWVSCRLYLAVEGSGPFHEVHTHLTKKCLRLAGHIEFEKNGQKLEIWEGRNCLVESQENACIKNLNTGYDFCNRGTAERGYAYAGNVVVMNAVTAPWTSPELPEWKGESKHYQDVTLADLRYAFDYFTCMNNIFESDTPNRNFIRKQDQWQKAVKISCGGDISFLGTAKYREVAIREDYEIFSVHNVSTVSEHMDCTLILKRIELIRAEQTK